jgi:hypothetical protein
MTRITVHADDVDHGAHIDIDHADDGSGYLIVTSDLRPPLEGKLDPGQLPGLSPDDAEALASVLVAQAKAARR